MKKFLAFALPAFFVLSITACGPSETEEKQEKDSVSKDMRSTEDRMIDSINKADSVSRAEAAKADSIKKADSASKAAGAKK